MMRTGALTLALIAAACASSSPEFSGAFLLPDEQHAVMSRVQGTRVVLELQRVAERNEREVLRWETLDRVEATIGRDEFACMSVSERGGGQYVVFAREDPPDHAHPPTRAWRIDLAARKLVVERDLAGLECDVDECLD